MNAESVKTQLSKHTCGSIIILHELFSKKLKIPAFSKQCEASREKQGKEKSGKI